MKNLTWAERAMVATIVIILLTVTFFGCSDDKTTVVRSIEIVGCYHGKGHNKDCDYEFWVNSRDCQMAIDEVKAEVDSLEALLEECRDD